nr:MAG TPA: SOS-response transcriptional repressor [Caudoviricetes sp.]
MQINVDTIGNDIRKLMIDKDIKLKELAEKIGNSSSNLSNKLNRNDLYTKDLKKIAEALECELIIELRQKK